MAIKYCFSYELREVIKNEARLVNVTLKSHSSNYKVSLPYIFLR